MSTTQFNSINVKGQLFINGEEVFAGNQVDEVLIDSASTAANQLPSALDTPLKVEFGGPVTAPDGSIELLANGDINFIKGGSYIVQFNARVGRTGTSGTGVIIAQTFFNGQIDPNFQAVAVGLPNAVTVHQLSFTVVAALPDNTTMDVEIVRDSAGSNVGGLYQFQPSVLPWTSAPSASIRISRLSQLT